jgi:hypothetical protein
VVVAEVDEVVLASVVVLGAVVAVGPDDTSRLTVAPLAALLLGGRLCEITRSAATASSD